MDALQSTQFTKLLAFMQKEPTREWIASDFQQAPYFIGYEAGPRLCGLSDRGLVMRTGKKGRFVKFQLTEAGVSFSLSSPIPKLEKKIKAEQKELSIDTDTINHELRKMWFSGLLYQWQIYFRRHNIIVLIKNDLTMRVGPQNTGEYFKFNTPQELLNMITLLFKYRVW